VGSLVACLGLVWCGARAVQSAPGQLSRVFTGNVAVRAEAPALSGSASPVSAAVRTDFPAGGWVIANKLSGKYHFGKTTEVWFPSAQTAEAAGYRQTAGRSVRR
jgi:hypothetical protein